MTHVLFNENYTSPLDVLVRNFFDSQGTFDKPSRPNVTHPIDVFEDQNGLTLEVACTGIDKKDVNINIEGDVLRLSYDKGKAEPRNGTHEGVRYYHSGIKKSNFNLGWKISRRFNLAKANAEMVNGLLVISIPFATESKPKSITIK
jgi:HSP20 family molecular chaperone IbpA